MSVLQMMSYAQFSQQKPPSLEKARENIMERLDYGSEQQKLNNLSTLLNTIINSQKFKESDVASRILERIPQIIDQGASEGLSNLSISNKMGVATSASKDAWREYGIKSSEYKRQVEQGIENASLAKEVEQAKKVALSLQGKLNTLQGQAFESLLQCLLPLISENTQNLASEIVDQLLSNLNNMTGAIQTSGSKSYTIDLQLDEYQTSITSQGKVDVSVNSPFISESDVLQISAKNYSQLRNIHLLKGGSVVGLISQWPTSESDKQYYYNALGVWHPDKYLQNARLIFGIQSLVGRGDQDLASILILNIRSRVNPISVISTKSLIYEALKNPVKNKSLFDLKFNSLPVYHEGESRNKDEYGKKVSSVTLDSSLNKAYLTVAYLSHLK